MEEVYMDAADPMQEQRKGCPTVVFEVVASHATRVLHVSCMFWGRCSDALIDKFEEAVHEVMDGRHSTLALEVSEIDGDKINDHGMFYNMSSNCFHFLYVLFLTCHSLVNQVRSWALQGKGVTV
jgi:hypothetical protein